MSDSVDRVFAHALQTVRRIPRIGSARPPPEARLKLYGLYKQSMEGDVQGVMERPRETPTEGGGETEGDDGVTDSGGAGSSTGGGRAEIGKWDAWNAQAGLSKTEAKRRYITTLIETMHKYASATLDARELVSELEFVWDQIRSNVPSTHTHSIIAGAPFSPDPDHDHDHDHDPEPDRDHDHDHENDNDNDQVLGIVSPNPYGDEVDRGTATAEETDARTPRERAWRQRVEKALAKMTTEVAGLREQLESRRAAERRRNGYYYYYGDNGGGSNARRVWMWVLWATYTVVRHLAVEAVFWGIVFLWMRRRGDRRAEESLRVVMRFVREAFGLGNRNRRKGGSNVGVDVAVGIGNTAVAGLNSLGEAR